MLNNSHIYHQTKHDTQPRGIDVSKVELNLAQMLKAKDTSVASLTKGAEGLFKKNNVDYIKGEASFVAPNRLSVNLLDGDQMELEGKNIIIATDSEVTPFPGIVIDEKQIVSSTGALELQQVPEKMVVIGGVIGLEMASVWSRWGSEVTVIEYFPFIGGAGLDEEIGKQFLKLLKKQALVISAEKTNGKAQIRIEATKGGKDPPQKVTDR